MADVWARLGTFFKPDGLIFILEKCQLCDGQTDTQTLCLSYINMKARQGGMLLDFQTLFLFLFLFCMILGEYGDMQETE